MILKTGRIMLSLTQFTAQYIFQFHTRIYNNSFRFFKGENKHILLTYCLKIEIFTIP